MLLGQDSPDTNHEQFTDSQPKLHLGNGRWSASIPKFTADFQPSERSKIPPKTGRNSVMHCLLSKEISVNSGDDFSQFHVRTAFWYRRFPLRKFGGKILRENFVFELRRYYNQASALLRELNPSCCSARVYQLNCG